PHLRALHSFPTRRSSDLLELSQPLSFSNSRKVPQEQGANTLALVFVEDRKSDLGATLYSIADDVSAHTDESLVGIGASCHDQSRSEEHTSELQSRSDLVC